MAGALRRHLAPLARIDGLVVHALLPIHVAAGASRRVGNHFGSVFVPLPVGVADAVERTRWIRDELRARRSRGAVMAGIGLASAAGVAPAAIERLGVAFFSRRASVMVSNVRGPARALHVQGVAVRDIVVWAPSPGSIGLGITLMSYAGRVRVGVAADACLVGPPGGIVEALEQELSRFVALCATT